MHVLFVVLLLLASATRAASQSAARPRTEPCASGEHRAFDFWVGEWIVDDAKGARAGTNRIELVLNRCALHESWTGADGNRGNSYSAWDASRNRWLQMWVDQGGNILRLEGGIEAGSIVMEGVNVSATATLRSRVRWSRLPDGRVRQHWELSQDDGKTWRTHFDGYYRRVVR